MVDFSFVCDYWKKKNVASSTSWSFVCRWRQLIIPNMTSIHNLLVVLLVCQKEELAFVFEMLQQFEDALVQYDELDALFSQYVVNFGAGGKCVKMVNIIVIHLCAMLHQKTMIPWVPFV